MKKELEKKYKGKKVLVWGLGLNGGGVGSAKFFAKLGAKVLVIDSKSKKELQASLDQLKGFKNIKYHFGAHRKEDFQTSDFIIRGPAIKEDNEFLQVARKAGGKIENDIGIFLENSPAYIIGITGTKGKSTITAWVYELIKYEVEKKTNPFFKKLNKVFFGGNNRRSTFDYLEKTDEKTIVVLELSSAQLEHAAYAKMSPNVAIITNIYPEHIPFHGTFAKYVDAKKMIFKFQKEDDYLIADKRLKSITKKAKSKKIYFHGGVNREVLEKLGEVFKITKTDLEKVIKGFGGIEGAQQFVKEVKGIRFINDTRATHPSAVSFALAKFAKPILIMGGRDKGFDREAEDLAKTIERRKIRTILLLPGSFSDRMMDAWSDGFKEKYLSKVGSMEEAVGRAYALAKKGDVVVMSPGGSSFDLFTNEFDRGDKFVAAVKRLRK